MNKTTLPPPPSIIAKILSEYSTSDLEKRLRQLTCDGDFVFGCHNESYDRVLIQKKKLKRAPHQWRIQASTMLIFLEEFTKLRIRVLDELNDFELIYEEIRKIAIKIDGAGALLVYDTALRYAYSREIHPKYVYLCNSNGPLAGAKSFFNIIGKSHVMLSSGKIVEVKKLKSTDKVITSEFVHIDSYTSIHIENILCCYHKALEKHVASLQK